MSRLKHSEINKTAQRPKEKQVKKTYIVLGIMALVLVSFQRLDAVEWHAWGVHDATIDASIPGIVEATVLNTAGQTPDYHWNKSSWDSRTGQKAFLSTDAFNGETVENAIQSISYTVDTGAWANAYWNIMVQDSNGKRAILSPAYYSATSTGFSRDGTAGSGNDFCIFEAEAGWTGTALTGWYAAEWDAIKSLVIADGPFTEFPDTTGGTAAYQNDPAYSVANWAAWADQAGGTGSGWEHDGFMFTFGQSTGTAPGLVRITNVSVNGVAVPEPGTIVMLGMAGLGLLVGIWRRQS
jgi:hypothetical protein